MAEREFKVETYGVDYVCDVCNEGIMVQEGKLKIDGENVSYPHRCVSCGTLVNLPDKYPTVRHRRVQA